MRLLVCALLVAIGLLPAFLLGVTLGIHYTPPPVDCAPYPVSTPSQSGEIGRAL